MSLHHVPRQLHHLCADPDSRSHQLRYLNSIAGKYKDQYANWLKKGIVSEEDAFIIAINPRAIAFDHLDADPPRILQAAYTVGSPYALVEKKTLKPLGVGYHCRDKIVKASEAVVETGVFQRDDYIGLSALLCSRVEVANYPAELGGDFQLAPNPHARVPLPPSFRLKGMYYDAKAEDGRYEIKLIR